MRTRFSDGALQEMPSFALTEKLPPVAFTVDESPQAVMVKTAKMEAIVDRASGAVTYADSQGNSFLSEAAGSRVLKPVTLLNQSFVSPSQSFKSPSEEKLYGLGQFQDGIWNWRGIPLELSQLNTQIAVPILLSSKGYGLLWDNSSRTDFNPLSEEIHLTPSNSSATQAEQGPTATEQLGKSARQSIAQFDGTFTTKDAGPYAFCTRDGDRRTEITILLDGQPITGITNMWTPRSVVGTVSLPAGKTCKITVLGGGRNVRLFAGRLSDLTTFRSDYGEAIDYTVFYGPRFDDIIAGIRNATGQAPLWPKWAYGLWQCRERYSSSHQILDTAAEFRKRSIPVDLIVQDWQYWGKYGWGAYQWDERDYPDPKKLIDGLHAQNLNFMISVWCNPHGKIADELKASHLLLKGGWIDVFSPQGREIRWKYINSAFFSEGTDAWWGDATEPGDPGTDLLGSETSMGPADRVTSAYPLFASQSLYEGQRSTSDEKRVCILTRSAWAGMQRYAAASWSGDINGTWDSFRRQIPAGLNFCLTGLPYWTTDCGGFFHPKDQYTSPDYNELLTRWFQWSTFCPILRTHGFSSQTEMWNYLPATQETMQAYDRLRYRMLPYNYTLGSRVTFQGDTIMRALGMDFPEDPKVWSISDEYMFGPAFLVSPVTTPQATNREVYLPSGTSWVNFWTGEKLSGGQTTVADAPLKTLPLFVRSGSIVPLGPDLQYTGEKPPDPIELRVYPGADGKFSLYEDEGNGYGYEKGAHALIPMSWDDSKKGLSIGARQGDFPGMLKERTFRVVVVSPGQGTGIVPAPRASEIHYDGSAVVAKP